MEFKEALKFLADKAGVKLQSFHNPTQESEKKKNTSILELATRFYEKQLWDGMGKEKILEYLHNRGINDASIRTFRIGYAPPGWRNILNFLLQRGFKLDEIIKTGLLVTKNTEQLQATSYKLQANDVYDRFRDRIMFPIQNLLGEVIGYSARVTPGQDEKQAKYINSPETQNYQKSKILYGIDKAKREMKSKDFVLVVEGNMDVIACHQAGIQNTVAVSGTALTEDHLDIIRRYTKNVKLLFDMDSAGQEAARKSVQLCFEKELNVFIVTLDGVKDAAEAVEKNPQILIDAAENAKPAMDHYFGQLFSKYDRNDSQQRKKIVAFLIDLIKHMSDPLDQSFWVKKVAKELEVEEKLLADVLVREKSKDRNPYRKEEDKKDVLDISRKDTLEEKISGILIARPNVWRRAYEEYQKENHLMSGLAKTKLAGVLLVKGEQFDFSFDNFIATVEDERWTKKLQNLFHGAKFTFDPQLGMIETREETWQEFEVYLKELSAEIHRERMDEIQKLIRRAESEGNKQEVAMLMQEFTKLLEQMKTLKS